MNEKHHTRKQTLQEREQTHKDGFLPKSQLANAIETLMQKKPIVTLVAFAQLCKLLLSIKYQCACELSYEQRA